MNMVRLRKRHTFTLPDDVIELMEAAIEKSKPPYKLEKSTLVEIALREYLSKKDFGNGV